MNDTDYEKYLPDKPPEGVINWLLNQGIVKEEYLIYRIGSVYNPIEDRNQKAVQCICTACGETFYQEYVKNDCCHAAYSAAPFGFRHSQTNEVISSGKKTICPNCGREVEALHIGKMTYEGNRFRTSSHHVMTVHRIGGEIALLVWIVQKFIDKNGNTEWDIKKYEGAVYEDKRAYRVCGYRSYLGNTIYFKDWEQRKRWSDNYGSIYAADVYPWDPEILIGTPLENCKLDIYMSSGGEIYPFSYLRLWQKHRNIENIIMQGGGYLVSEFIKGTGTYYDRPNVNKIEDINYKARRPCEMLGLNKEEFKIMMREKWGVWALKFYLRAKDKGVTAANVRECAEELGLLDGRLLNYDNNIPRTVRYLKKQRKKYRNKVGVIELTDYWNAENRLGEDLGNIDIKYPQNLKTAHDLATDRLNKRKSAIKRKEFSERYKELKKYCFEYNGLTIHPAKSAAEMRNEGQKLNHCVATYTDRHAEGKTTIFFIRHADAPEEPYFTLEFDFKNMRVIQNRGLRNCSRTAEVAEFEKQWVEFVTNTVKNERRAA